MCYSRTPVMNAEFVFPQFPSLVNHVSVLRMSFFVCLFLNKVCKKETVNAKD